MNKLLGLLATIFLQTFATMHAADLKPGADAVNALGIDLYRIQARGEGNLLLSPYSIQMALAMTYAGAGGETRGEMERVLHYPSDEAALHGSLAALNQALVQMAADSVERADKSSGGKSPIEWSLANRLFPQRGFHLLPAFVDFVKETYGAPIEELDYAKDPEKARAVINGWVEKQTMERIRELVPPRGVTPDTVLALVNGLYLRAPWATPFKEERTEPGNFLVHGRESVQVPVMHGDAGCGYARRPGFQLLTRFYDGRELQFVIVLPDKVDGLADAERQLSPKMLAECAHLPVEQIELALPKFRMEPPTLDLGGTLQKLGMKSAFGNADFTRMTAERGLSISAVFHKTFVALDEKGTEAAAATAVMMGRSARPIPNLEVKVDHPFLFAIQHVPSGACLFLGRVTDPR